MIVLNKDALASISSKVPHPLTKPYKAAVLLIFLYLTCQIFNVNLNYSGILKLYIDICESGSPGQSAIKQFAE
jgi:hypothetical protein